jgi:hypothetical protein
VSAALEAKLDSVVTQLKNIASGGFTYSTVRDATGRTKVKAKVDKQEAEKLKITAKIQADASAHIYKKVLGLGFNEEKAKKTAKIFKDVFGMGGAGGGFSKKSTKDSVNYLLRQMEWFDFAGDLMHYAFNTQEYQEEMLYSMRTLIGLQPNSKDKKKTDSSGGLMDKLKSIAGLAVLGIGFFLIINALSSLGKIDIGKTLKILAIIGLMVGIFLLVSLAGGAIKNAAIGFAILAATVAFLIIPTMMRLTEIKFETILEGLGKFVLIVGACIGLMVLMRFIKKSDVLVATGGLLALSLMVGFLIIPLLQHLTETKWNIIIDGLVKFAIIVGVMIGLMALMRFIKKGEVIVATIAMGALVYLVGYLADNLQKYAYKPWDSIKEGLKIAGLAFGAFFAMFGVLAVGVKVIGKAGMALTGVIMFELVYLVGYLADNLEKYARKDWKAITEGLEIAGIAFGALVAAVTILAGAMAIGGPIAIVAGAVAGGVMLALAKVMNMSADALIKFGSVNGKNLITVAEGMVAIGAGLVAMMGGSVLGTAGAMVDKLSSLVGLDPVSFLKKFEVLDGVKLLNIGTGIKYLAEGLKTLSQGIEIKNIVNDLILLTTPLLSFTSALDSFSNSYKQLEKIKMESEMNQNFNMTMKSDTGIQKAILDLHAQELSVQQAQLEQLKINGNLLHQLVSNGGMGKGVSAPQQTISIKSPNFSTKENFMNNMKLTSMSLQS